MSKDASAEQYQNNKEILQKKSPEKYQSFQRTKRKNAIIWA